MKIELCLQNIDDILIAEKYKHMISTIELNSSLQLGGLTPSIEFIKMARKYTSIKLISMLRPREGNFVYSDLEFELICNSVEDILKYCDGIAFGALLSDGSIDIVKTKKILDICKNNGKQFVFHRAIDECNDYFNCVKLLDDLGVDRILTSGHESNCVIGYSNILKLNTNCEILIGCGINLDNISLFKDKYIHGTFSKQDSYKKLDENILKKLGEIY